jgi:membrane protein YqaA with SNARE-associated domain
MPPHLAEYLRLFGAAFLSATVFPFQSEVVLFSMLLAERYEIWPLVAAASLGDILGSCIIRHPGDPFPIPRVS